MVALATSLRSRRLPSADFDPTSLFQGTVGIGITQFFTIQTAGVISDPRTGWRIREWMFCDHFGNQYLAYRAVCSDHEEYDLGDRLKPSLLLAHKSTMGDLLDKYRAKAFFSFAKTDEAINVTRKVAGEITKKVINAEKLLIPGTDLAS